MFPTSSNPRAMIALALFIWPLTVGLWLMLITLVVCVCVCFPFLIPAVVAGGSRREVRHGV